MDAKKIRTSTSRFLGWLGLNLCSLIIKVSPGNQIYAFARRLGVLGYGLARKPRNIARESLSLAFGSQKSSQEIDNIARNCFVEMAKSGVELIYLNY